MKLDSIKLTLPQVFLEMTEVLVCYVHMYAVLCLHFHRHCM